MSRIKVFVGRNGFQVIGNGKTLSMTIYLYKYKTKTDYKVVSNYEVDFLNHFFESDNYSEALKEYEKTVIGIDELPSIISSYSGVSDKGNNFRNLLRQARKRDLIILTTAQLINDVPAFMRRQNIDIYVVYKIHPDKTFCEYDQNKDCPYKDHYYLIIRQGGQVKILSPHLKTSKGKIRNYFYDAYKSEEIIG